MMGVVRLTSKRRVCLLLLPCWGTVFSWCIHNAGAEVRSVHGFAPHSVTTSLLTITFSPKFRFKRKKNIEINLKKDKRIYMYKTVFMTVFCHFYIHTGAHYFWEFCEVCFLFVLAWPGSLFASPVFLSKFCLGPVA